jgi:hypothetical protein
MNKRSRRSLYLVGFLILLYILQQVGVLNNIVAYIGALPFWVVLVITGILISFWQFLKHSQDEEIEEDEKWIEEQGAVYIKRMSEERERRKNKPSQQI